MTAPTVHHTVKHHKPNLRVVWYHSVPVLDLMITDLSMFQKLFHILVTNAILSDIKAD